MSKNLKLDNMYRDIHIKNHEFTLSLLKNNYININNKSSNSHIVIFEYLFDNNGGLGLPLYLENIDKDNIQLYSMKLNNIILQQNYIIKVNGTSILNITPIFNDEIILYGIVNLEVSIHLKKVINDVNYKLWLNQKYTNNRIKLYTVPMSEVYRYLIDINSIDNYRNFHLHKIFTKIIIVNNNKYINDLYITTKQKTLCISNKTDKTNTIYYDDFYIKEDKTDNLYMYNVIIRFNYKCNPIIPISLQNKDIELYIFTDGKFMYDDGCISIYT